MKIQKYAVAAVILCAALLVSRCATLIAQLSAGKVVFDDSLAPEESAVVVFGNSIHVLEYNGIGVEDAWYPKKKYRINTVTLPAGEASILFDYYVSISRGNTIYPASGEGIELKFHFEAGKEYTVVAYTKTEGFIFVKIEYGLAIWDHATTSSPGSIGKSVKSWKLGEM
ncbi:MAG: hypothetical protein LBG27_07540 [Spirochaetaceae bacterium]|jgi:hypothetical protein|nr:hypothetical protein [Spirochaetaceae bacterium]